MDYFWAALLLGFGSSLHCVAMCGPLAMTCPVLAPRPWPAVLSRGLYHTGRVTMYALLGLFLGQAGHFLRVIGMHKGVALGLGLLLLASAFFRRIGWSLSKDRLWQVFSTLRKPFLPLFRRRNAGALFLLGMLNGLIPCGMVYAAAALSLATGSAAGAVAFMALFGIGTTPLLVLGSAVLSGLAIKFPVFRRLAFSGMVAFAGILLVLRGLNLGVPWLSPSLTSWLSQGPLCR